MQGKDIVFSVGLVIALVLGAVGTFQQDTAVERVVERLGVAAGPDHTETQFFKNNFTVGDGTVASTSDIATYTLTNREVDTDTAFVSWTPDLNVTLTMMASTSAPFSNLKAGESFEQLWYNASTTAGATITFGAGTGVDLQEDEGGSVIVNGLETARVTYVKKADTDVAVIVEPYQVGD